MIDFQLFASGFAGGALALICVSRQYWDQLPYQPKCGDECLVYFNRYGKVSSFAAA